MIGRMELDELLREVGNVPQEGGDDDGSTN